MSPGASLVLPAGDVIATTRHRDPSLGEARRAFDRQADRPPRRDAQTAEEPASVEVGLMSSDMVAPSYGPYLTAWSAVLVEASKGGFLDVRV